MMPMTPHPCCVYSADVSGRSLPARSERSVAPIRDYLNCGQSLLAKGERSVETIETADTFVG